MNKFTLTINAEGVIDDESIDTRKCQMRLQVTDDINVEIADQLRIHLLSSMLSDFTGIDIKEVIREHIEIQNAIKYK